LCCEHGFVCKLLIRDAENLLSLGSAVLVSSNLTNLVLAGAFSISFPTFTAFMALPFLAAAIATYPVFLIMFRRHDYIPRSIDVQGEESAIEPSSVLTDKWGAIFGSALLTVTLGVLVGTSILKIPVWQITVPPAAIMLIRDIVYDWHTLRQAPQPESIEMEQTTVTSQTDAIVGAPPPRRPQRVQGFWKHLAPSYITSRFPTATTVLKRLPVALVPFALLTFVLVQGLTRKGWVELFANGWAWWARNTGVIGVTAGMGIIACILCNVRRLYPPLHPPLIGHFIRYVEPI
jgi:Na+/H+ antiporter NhaD/arsenite permease-like protein